MSKPLDTLHALLARLEAELPRLILLHPDADGAEFWMAFSRRSTRIEAMAASTDMPEVRARIDRMLASRGLLDARHPSHVDVDASDDATTTVAPAP